MKKYCEECGLEICDFLPFKCKHCEQLFCKTHLLPENHNCTDFKSIDTSTVKSELPIES